MKAAMIESSGRIYQVTEVPNSGFLIPFVENLGFAVVDITDLNVKDTTHYFTSEGFVEYPPQPSIYHHFDYDLHEWVDSISVETRLQDRRAQAFLPKLEFIMRTVTKGYISKASGLSLLAGQIPQELIGLPDLLNEEQIFELQAKLIAASQVDRLDPFIQVVAWYMGLSDADVDLLFDVETPAPIA